MSSKKRTGQPTIGLVMKSLTAEFFQSMRSAAIAHAEKRGDLTLIPVGTESQTEVEMQVHLVNELISQQVDALVVIPIDSKTLVEPVASAINTGIKVINADVMLESDLMEAFGIEPPFVGPDNVAAAKVASDFLARELGAGGKVVIIEGIPSAINAQQRKEGFLLSVEQNNLVLLDMRSANWESQQAHDVFQDILQQHPDVEGVMCANDAMALGVMQAIESNPMAHQIFTVGIDNDISIRPFIQDGRMLASIDLLGEEMVVRSIDYAMDALEGKDRRGWIKTPIRVITRETLTELSF